MEKNINGSAIVLYTFSKDGNDEKYRLKVEALENLLPDNRQKLEDQSSILIKSECDIEELEQRLNNYYNGELEKDECIILVSINGSCLKCMCIDSTPQEAKLVEALNSLLTEPDVTKTKEYCDVLLNNIHENTKQVFDQIISENTNDKR